MPIKTHPAVSVLELRETFFVNSPAGVFEITERVYDLLKAAENGLSENACKDNQQLVNRAKAAGLLVDRHISGIDEDPLSAVFDFLSDYRSRVGAISRFRNVDRIVVLGDGEIAAAFHSLAPEWLCELVSVANCETFLNYTAEGHSTKGSLLVFCPDQVSQSDLLRINGMCVSRDIPWLPVIIGNSAFCIGPLVYPGSTACIECVLVRANSNSIAKHASGVVTGFPFGKSSWPTAEISKRTAFAAASFAAVQCDKAVRGINDLDGGSEFYVVSLLDIDCRKSCVLRVPRCPTCGSISDEHPVHAFLNMN